MQTQTAKISVRTMPSPVGQLTLVARGDRLAAITWESDRAGRVKLSSMTEAHAAADNEAGLAVLLKTESQLREYFAGERKVFEIELDFEGTEFQKRVWNALLTIPFGETRSYLDVAIQLGDRNATRAVGAANGKNPISIIAPCHRVIGASGALTGFAGGLEAKKLLLDLEQANRQRSLI